MMPAPNLELIAQVRQLADGETSSTEIAQLLGRNPRHIGKILLKYDLPRLAEGAMAGEQNHQFVAGRRVTLSGYAQITPPEGHSTAKQRKGRKAGYMFEHRYVAEKMLGRPLEETERVDHVDGLTLHNHPDNLRVFASNAEHLKATLTGKVPQWSAQGYANMSLRHHQPEALELVDIHHQRIAAGATRLRQILLLALRLGTDSPYLLGTTRWTKKAGIDMSQRSTIEHALAELCARWGWGHSPS
jgi:hypothetical protein